MNRRDFLKGAFLSCLVWLEMTGCLPRGTVTGPDKKGEPAGSTAPPAGRPPEAAKAPEPPKPAEPSKPAEQSKPAAGPGASELIIVQGKDPVALIEKGLEAMGGVQRFVKKGSLVVIKPNFSVPRAPAQAATTNTQLVCALVRKCLAAGAREVRVIDHPFTNGEMCLESTGMRKDVTAAGGKCYVLNTRSDKFYTAVTLAGPTLKAVEYSRDVLEADFFVNFPILKHHNTTRLTMSLKNMMGLVWDRGALHSSNLHRAIPEITAFKRAHLTILDATRGITDRGPMGPGAIKECNQVIFGMGPVAIDAYGAELFGVRPGDVEHLRIASDMGLGQIDWRKLQVTRV